MMRSTCSVAGLLVAAAILCGCDSAPRAATVATESPAAAKPRPKLLPGAKTKVLAAAGDREFDKTFDDLRFDMQIGKPFRREMLTDAIEALDGKQIRIRGFILPTAQQRGIREFVLVRDNQECCFGPGAALFDCILVEMQTGQTAEYTIRPVAVSGTFAIREFVVDGQHMAIYQIDGETVK
jgi:hypothetical protein